MSNFAMPSNGDANKDLIPLTDNDGVQAVMGRDLHAFLEVGRDYTNWFKDMCQYGFVAGQDFTPVSAKTSAAGGRPRQDHILSLDMAKEIAMIQRTERGKQARQYFIECEKRIKQVPDSVKEAIASMTRMEWLQVALNAEEERLGRGVRIYADEQGRDFSQVGSVARSLGDATSGAGSVGDSSSGGRSEWRRCGEGGGRFKIAAVQHKEAVQSLDCLKFDTLGVGSVRCSRTHKKSPGVAATTRSVTELGKGVQCV